MKSCTITHIHPLKQLHDWDGLRAWVPLGMVVNAARKEQHQCRAAVGSQGLWEARLYQKEGGSQHTAASSSLSSTGRQPSCQRYLFTVSTDRWPCKTEIHTSQIQNKNKRTESMSQPPAPSEKRDRN